MEQKASPQKTLVGTVVSAKAKDTVTVSVSRYVKHPKYKKYIVTTKKFLAHDAGNTRKVGERVMIRSCRPMSKRKHFIIV
ncbi:MAG TPA: 30S ribosomal protein S17 [Candidatus Paceibacterota bacterium]